MTAMSVSLFAIIPTAKFAPKLIRIARNAHMDTPFKQDSAIWTFAIFPTVCSAALPRLASSVILLMPTIWSPISANQPVSQLSPIVFCAPQHLTALLVRLDIL